MIVEDGTGLPNADSYAAIATADVYLDKYGYSSWANLDDDSKAIALRRGTQYVDLVYGSRWRGTRKMGRAQALDWPRIDVYDCEGVPVPSDAVPYEVVYATIEAAWREGNEFGFLLPDATTTQIEKRVQVGQLSVEYFDPRTATGVSGSTNPEIPVIEDLVANLLTDCGRSSQGGIGMGWLARA